MVVSEGSNSGNIKPESPVAPQEDSLFSAPIRQSSVFSLTLDEYQVRSGKSFSSMNLDELLNHIWNGDENALFSAAGQEERRRDRRLVSEQPHLPPQGSFSIPPPLCNKTIDQVWTEINKNKQLVDQDNNGGQGSGQGEQSFGEMTLEDFLVKVGVVQDIFVEEATDSSQLLMLRTGRPSGSFPNSNTNLETTFGIADMMGLGFSASQNSGNDVAAYLGKGNKFPGESAKTKDEGKGEPAASPPAGQKGKKRASDEALEMAVERRQRRMIKNRESAARSRARKQAYTVELELELNQLKEENTKLKKVVADAERKRREKQQKAMEGKEGTRADKIARQLKTLRRTVSAPCLGGV